MQHNQPFKSVADTSSSSDVEDAKQAASVGRRARDDAEDDSDGDGDEDSEPSRRRKRARVHDDLYDDDEEKVAADENEAGGVSPSSLVEIVVDARGQEDSGGARVPSVARAAQSHRAQVLSEDNLLHGLQGASGLNEFGLGLERPPSVAMPAPIRSNQIVVAPAARMMGNPQYQQAMGTQAFLQPQPGGMFSPPDAGTPQQYLQGYLTGLQQAKASGSRNLVAPQNVIATPHTFATPQNIVGPFQQTALQPSLMTGLPNAIALSPVSQSQRTVVHPIVNMNMNMNALQQQMGAAASTAFPLGLSNNPASPDPLLGPILNPPISARSIGIVGNNAALGLGSLSTVDGFPLTLPQVLARPDDAPNLTNHQILLRNQIEVFQATEDDASTHTRGRNKPIMVGQVGVRCKHCKTLPVLQRQKGSTYFPNSLMGIYQAAQNMNTVHMQCGLCTEMPEEVKRQFVHSMCYSKVHQSGAGRHYWARSAKKLGLVDTEKDGIRFIRDVPPGAIVLETPPA